MRYVIQARSRSMRAGRRGSGTDRFHKVNLAGIEVIARRRDDELALVRHRADEFRAAHDGLGDGFCIRFYRGVQRVRRLPIELLDRRQDVTLAR